MPHYSSPIPETVCHVHGFPRTLTLFKISASPYWYVRAYSNGRLLKQSSRETEKARALRFAKTWWVALSATDCSVPSEKSHVTLAQVAEQVIQDDVRKVTRGERSPGIVRDARQVLRKHVQPFFGLTTIQEITYARLCDFVDALGKAKLSTASIRLVHGFVRKTLKYARRHALIDQLPEFPVVSGKVGVRGWFSRNEYLTLHKQAIALSRQPTRVAVRHTTIDEELAYFIAFMVETFVRPSDAKLLRNRHIEVIKRSRATSYLLINTPFSKTQNSPIVSMPGAVGTYDAIRALQLHRGFGSPDDFVFMPQFAGRDHALEMLRRQFNVLLEQTGLKISASGPTRTIYSLRHTAIMFRLTSDQPVDLLTLARNARTSVEMIDKFYARHLTAEMNVDALHGRRRASRR